MATEQSTDARFIPTHFPRLKLTYAPGGMDGPARHNLKRVELDGVEIHKVTDIEVHWGTKELLTASLKVIIAGVDEVEEEA